MTAARRGLGKAASSTAALVVLAVICAGLAAALAVGAVGAYTSALPSGAALRVGDQVVTVAELDRRAAVLRALYGVQAPSAGVELDHYHREIAKSTAIAMVTRRAARKRNITIPESQVRGLLAMYTQQNYPQGRDAWVQALGAAGVAEPELLKEIELQNITGRLFDDVTREAPEVKTSDVVQAYQVGKDQLVVPEQRHLRNIVVASQRDAEDVLAEVRAGEDFGALAREYSLDATSRDSGGDIGVTPAKALEQQYADAAFSTASHQIFGPVRTRNGWNIGQVADILPPRPLTLGEVAGQLKERMELERKLAIWREFMISEIAKAHVTYAAEYQPPDSTSLPPAPRDFTLPQQDLERSAVGPTHPAGAAPTTGRVLRAPVRRNPWTPPEHGPINLLIVQVLVAAVLFFVGIWGRANAHLLPARALAAEERVKRAHVYRRGSITCQVSACILAASAVVTLLV